MQRLSTRNQIPCAVGKYMPQESVINAYQQQRARSLRPDQP